MSYALFILVNIDSLRLLCLVLVLCTVIDIEVVEKTTTERTLREHTLHSVTDNLVHTVRTLAELPELFPEDKGETE